MKKIVLFAFLIIFSSFAFASVEMTFPEKAVLEDSGSVQAGTVSPGQSFDLVFSDNSGGEFEWDSIELVRSSLPANWVVLPAQKTDSSIALTITVPLNEQENTRVLKVRLSNSNQGVSEQIGVVVSVKKSLVNVSFARVSQDTPYSIGDKIKYTVTASNSSIARDSVLIGANLPSTWFVARRINLKPKDSAIIEIVVVPQSYGKRTFSFSGFLSSKNAYISSFATEVEIIPTLKGKFSATSSGFPFFTFSLLPFQLIDSIIAGLIK